MVDYLYPSFLSNPYEYEQAEALWRDRWEELLRWAGQREERWKTPWLNTDLANGVPCRDGNPIFSAICPSRRLGLRVIQLEPSGEPRELYFWIDMFGEGEETIKELVISCALTEETLYDALNLMSQWLTRQEVRLSREDYYPTFPVPSRAAGIRRPQMAVA